MGLSTLAVIYVGLAGGHHGKVEKQVAKLVKQLHVESHPVAAASLHALTHHDATTRDLVKKLHTDGVIGFEVTDKGALRVVIYDGAGKLASFSESPLDHEALSNDDLDVLRDNLSSDLESLTGHPVDAEPAADPELAAPTPAAHVTPAIAAAVHDAAPARATLSPSTAFSPPARAAVSPPPTKIVASSGSVSAPADGTADDATATASADDDAVSAADIEAMTGGGSKATTTTASADDGAPDAEDSPLATTESAEPPVASTDPELHIGVAAGIGIATRSFSPGPSAVAGYNSSPVGAVRLDVDVAPTQHMQLRLSTERTLGMTTPLDSGDASTTVSRWEASGGYALGHGRVSLIPTVGLGRRAFSIDSMDMGRSPDNAYDYLMLGAAARTQLGKRLSLRGLFLFEPVVGGAEATEMALGEASRWAVDAGTSLDVKFGHAHVRAAADYQRFTWAWNMAGARGAGGATDSYLTASVSIGAEY